MLLISRLVCFACVVCYECFLGFRMCASQPVQYFQFDSDGNMFVYPPGSGFSGIPKLVQPGDELFTNETVQRDAANECNLGISNELPQCSYGLSTQVVKQSQREYNNPLKPEELEKLKYKNFSPETNKKIKWATKMYRE